MSPSQIAMWFCGYHAMVEKVLGRKIEPGITYSHFNGNIAMYAEMNAVPALIIPGRNPRPL